MGIIFGVLVAGGYVLEVLQVVLALLWVPFAPDEEVEDFGVEPGGE